MSCLTISCVNCEGKSDLGSFTHIIVLSNKLAKLRSRVHFKTLPEAQRIQGNDSLTRVSPATVSLALPWIASIKFTKPLQFLLGHNFKVSDSSKS